MEDDAIAKIPGTPDEVAAWLRSLGIVFIGDVGGAYGTEFQIAEFQRWRARRLEVAVGQAPPLEKL